MVSASSDVFVVTPEIIDTIQGDGSRFTVIACSLTQENALDGTLADYVNIDWQLTGKAGSFTTLVLYFTDWPDAASVLIPFYADVIDRVYAIAV
jgi:hypothetical protein